MTLRNPTIAAWQNDVVDAMRGKQPYNAGCGNVGLVQ